MSRTMKILVAMDKFVGTLLFRGIKEDQTISAYVWQEQYKIRIFLIDLIFGYGHCRTCYEKESSK